MNILYDLLINIIQLHLHVLKYFNKTVFNFLNKRKKIFKKLKSNISKNENSP